MSQNHLNTPSQAPFIHNHYLLNTIQLFEMNTVLLLLNTSSNTNYNLSGSGVIAFWFQLKKKIPKKTKKKGLTNYFHLQAFAYYLKGKMNIFVLDKINLPSILM